MLGWIGLAVVALGVIWLLCVTLEFIWGFAQVGWTQLRWVRRGRCPEKHCHRRGSWVKYQTDNLYGTHAKVLLCPVHGQVGIPSGERRAVNW